MKSPETPLADDGYGLHEEIEEMFAGHGQQSSLPTAPTPVRTETNLCDGPELWRPRKGDNPPKDGPLTIQQVVAHCDGQAKKWSKRALADDFKEMKCCDAYSLVASQFKHVASLLKRVTPAASLSSDSAAAAKGIVNRLLFELRSGAKAISTADAVRILVPAFPHLFDGATTLKAAGKRLRGLLQGLGVWTHNIRINGQVVKGYRVADLRQAVV
jgi:hypothetical protein